MKFLVCYEEANPSAVILKEAQAHAKVWNATLEIVKAVTRELPIKHSKILEMEKEMEASVSEQIGDDNVSYNVQLLVTSLEPGEKLVKFAEEEEIDLIFTRYYKKIQSQQIVLWINSPICNFTCVLSRGYHQRIGPRFRIPAMPSNKNSK